MRAPRSPMPSWPGGSPAAARRGPRRRSRTRCGPRPIPACGCGRWPRSIAAASTERPRLCASRAAGGIPGSLATGWLLGVDAIEPTEEALRESLLGVVDQLSALAEAGFVEDAFEGQPVAEQVRMVAELSRTDHPDLPAVLDAIADAPVERKVAKAARSARLRLRSG
ncbi:MAG: DUF4404 family protein [Pseudonocardia sp.]|nr:DUF4404 family protein [Pseudonocardia sp.]